MLLLIITLLRSLFCSWLQRFWHGLGLQGLAWIQVSCFWSQFQLPIYFWNEKFGGNPFQPWDREQVSVLPALLLAGGWLQFWGEKGQLQCTAVIAHVSYLQAWARELQCSWTHLTQDETSGCSIWYQKKNARKHIRLEFSFPYSIPAVWDAQISLYPKQSTHGGQRCPAGDVSALFCRVLPQI